MEIANTLNLLKKENAKDLVSFINLNIAFFFFWAMDNKFYLDSLR